ncbi:hypothetical protein [Bradyrhizobium sp.]|uniref:hypothetical protein n=1 Tax=Bradyrhizobium sp. TaxID=376 RepID=UPI001D6CFF68|nr:hypothetical protein [Bradyrhizobium sp.]MBI5322375.1 hypothetical protein [Bradyrhizobium sp.]
MPPDSAPAADPEPELPAPNPPGPAELSFAFARMSLAGFGGVPVRALRRKPPTGAGGRLCLELAQQRWWSVLDIGGRGFFGFAGVV